jgi:hypothetical protein
MNPHGESTRRTYTEAELAGLFATYFGDKLSQSQLDSLVAAVADAHASRRASAAESNNTARTDVPCFFGGWAPA